MPHFLGSRVFNIYILKTRVFNIYTYILKPDYQESGAFRPKVGHCDHGVPKCGGIATSRLGHCNFEIRALRLGSRGIATGAFRQWGIPTTFPCTHRHAPILGLALAQGLGYKELQNKITLMVDKYAYIAVSYI